MILIGDTSGLIVVLNTADPEHNKARSIWRQAALVVISPLVFMEIEHITTRNINRRAALIAHNWLLQAEQDGLVAIPTVDATTLRRARKIQDRYSDLRLDLADAVNVILAEQYETDAVLTRDQRDFRVITPLTGHSAFRILPDDL
jgi:predicted nucleic acid-binding protein